MFLPPWSPVFSLFWILPLLTSVSHVAAGNPTRWGLPLPGVSPGAIIAPFDPPTSIYGSGHRGVDFPASHGQQVAAVGSGIVSFAGIIAGKPVVSIELSRPVDSSGIAVRATYEPIRALVNTGDFVYAGETIGQVDFSSDNAGHCRGACLHFGLKVMADATPHYLNPAILWRSSALLQPSLAAHRSLIADGQSQKFSEASRR
jgi:murein DD-endopeptidase MepM/ murein hydrolase activator NlpD